MHFLIFLLTYKSTTKITLSNRGTLLNDFGFEENGVYQLIFSEIPENTIYALIPNSELSKYRKILTVKDATCDSIFNLDYFFNTSSANFFSGVIQKKGIYTPILIRCDKTERTQLKITEIYYNPGNCLDYRYNGLFHGKIAICIFLLIILIYWIWNWVSHFTIQVGIHYFLTSVFASNVMYQVIRLCELYVTKKQDNSVGLTPIRIIFLLVSETIFYATLLLCVKGWCIVYDTLLIRDILLSLVYPTVFMLFRILSIYVVPGFYSLITFFVAFISLLFFIRDVVLSLSRTSKYIMAHLLTISNSGIDPKTTPIYKKHIMYRNFRYLFFTICGTIVFVVFLNLFVETSFTAVEIVEDVIEVIIMGALALLFRLKGNKNTNYSMIPETSMNDDIHAIDIHELDTINESSLQLNSGGKAWEEGMPLPGMPPIIESNENESHSPEELDSLKASLIDENLHV
ncbi:hypothetical protein TRFO_05591 [Tritrichomonas foetus]|uniref:Intimal thickness related receptor IRP domain-containing protein n=1 Tax=Tritrichomonas foetus TaxID=1144522 RepID=A0A1J4K684_9EUKA|nr:hypothetical protein TRFO_05591 [Tritrichomonas foetus]|eukprot:OHT06392.1 hypothetical protein TRFO_05591 [Tritrichomonas foetus]